jgi:short-subunit dehydrogenase
MDPFVFIDPEWEYADEYTSVLSPEMYGKWACIVGAAEGLGRAFAINMAQRQFNLILVDKNEQSLGATIQQLNEKYQVEVKAVLHDLNESASVDQVMAELKQTQCRILIYNASYGPVKAFLKNNTEEIERYINVNIRTTIGLIHQFLSIWPGQNKGIILLSSLAGFRGTQLAVPYAATKAYLWNLAEGLHYEFKDSGLKISVCVPGTIDTPNFRSTRPMVIAGAGKPMNPDRVAEVTLNKFGRKLFIIPGRRNQLIHLILNRLLPRSWAGILHNNGMKKMYGGIDQK